MTGSRLQRTPRIVREPDMRFPSSRVAVTPNVRAQLAAVLSDAIAATVDLHGQVERTHFSIRSPQLVTRHELFDRLAANLVAWCDLLAVRCGTLGGYARGSVRAAAAAGTLPPEYESAAIDVTEPYAGLAARYLTYVIALRHLVTIASPSDPITADVLAEVLQGAELDLWFLESHVDAGRRREPSEASAIGG